MALRVPVRLLSLDCTGTLFTWSASIGTLYNRGFTRGISAWEGTSGHTKKHVIPSADEIDSRFPLAYADVWRKWPLYGRAAGVTSFDWWHAVAWQALGESTIVTDREAFNVGFAEVYRIFQTREAYRLYEDTIPFLEWARGIPNLQICVLSNVTESYRDKVLPALGLEKYVDFGVYSKLAGIEKPDRAVFELVAENAKVDLREVLHIGNDARKDAAGARAAGCHALFLSRECGDQVRPTTRSADVVTVRSLLEARRWMELGL